MRLLALSGLLALAAFGQIEVYTLTATGVESPAPNLVEVGTVAPGDILDTRFRVRNIGSTTATLQVLRISGPGFSLQGNPTGPRVLTPNANVDFRVRFQPATTGIHNAFLTVNERLIVVRGDAPAGLALGIDREGIFEPVSNERPVDFGRVEIGASSVLRFLIRNDSGTTATISRIGLTGIFEGPLDLRLPAEVPPGSTVAFGIRFAPHQTIVFHGNLEIDGRIIPLEGTAIAARLPPADLLFGNTGSGQQAALSIRFRGIVQSRATMTLKMTFQSAVGAQDDPAVVILPLAEREAVYVVTPGETGRQITFQTGTTAGRIRFRAEEAGRLLGESAVIEIPPAPVRISSAGASRQADAVEVAISGFDNTRAASEALFTFYGKEGEVLTPEPVKAVIRQEFSAYFRDSPVGGLFRMRAVFPVSGDAASIGAVMVEMVNPAGSARSDRIRF